MIQSLVSHVLFNFLQIISSLACAQKGWINNGVDKIACESCGACLCFTALSSWTSAEGW